MPTEIYIVTVIVGFMGTMGGIAIGFYKSKAEIAREYIRKEDCERCSMKTEVAHLIKDVTAAAKTLKDGRELFKTLQIDMAVIKTKLGIQSDVDELRGMLQRLEKKEA